MSTDTTVDLVVIGLGPGGEHLATQAARAGLTRGRRRRAARRGRVPVLRLRPVEDGDPRGEHARRGTPGRRAGRVGPDGTRLGQRRDPHQGRRHRRLGRPRRGRAAREGGGALRAWSRPARRAGRRRGRRDPVRRVARRRAQHRDRSLGAPGRRPRRHPFWTNRDVLRTAELPASMVVIGGGAIGAELAQAFARFGTRISARRGGAADPRRRGAGGVRGRGDARWRRTASRCSPGVDRRSVRHADGRFTVALTDAGGHRPRPRCRPAARRGRPPAQPLRHRARDRGARPRAPGRSTPTRGCGRATGCGRSATSPARAPSPTCRCTRRAVALADITGRDGRTARPSTTPCHG